ncbi:hypothetical protein FHS32_005525 [Streptomyces albaduncus]|uniref:Uncharacterized protein n=1 Tax=Streptomyces griseoloalbus TaxID=67303 RepID=A0A7W8FA12_9ACTN|nr:hypothetical protein [Streptomyces albaduncus]GGW46322.1 hypothetical protein GCM10010340_25480 [Streptomyces albaduncus]
MIGSAPPPCSWVDCSPEHGSLTDRAPRADAVINGPPRSDAMDAAGGPGGNHAVAAVSMQPVFSSAQPDGQRG